MNLRFDAVKRGIRQTIPVAVGDFAVGVIFGIAARHAGMDVFGALLMSGLVAAGTAQFVALGIWSAPLPILTIIITTFLVNLRYVLMSAALAPIVDKMPARKVYTSAFFLTDETFALMLRDHAKGGRDIGFLVGGGALLVATWISGTFVGLDLGSGIKDPAQWGLDFAAIGVMVAVLVGMWEGRHAVLPWVAAAGVSLLAAKFVPGNWYIVLGGIAGSIVGTLTESKVLATKGYIAEGRHDAA